MVDIEPMLTYDYSNFGIKNAYSVILLFYISFIYPIIAILNYDVKTNKQAVQDIVKQCMKITKCNIYKVSKRDLIIDKNIMYMTNHVSVGDFFIDQYVLHYASKFVAHNKIITTNSRGYMLPYICYHFYFIGKFKRKSYTKF